MEPVRSQIGMGPRQRWAVHTLCVADMRACPGVKLRFSHGRHKKRSRMLQATTRQQASGASLWKRASYNLPPGVTGETLQALARSEQVRGRLRHI